MRVLIVDDSVVVRSAIRAALEGDARIEVAGTASNGKIALEMVQQKHIDVITLDLEMPVVDGIQTLKALRALKHSCKVIVVSATTTRGSEMTLEALTHGAQDFVTKPKADSPEQAAAQLRADLMPKILQFLKPAAPAAPAPAPAAAKPASPVLRRSIATIQPAAIVIASSTGGPAALEEIFRGMRGQPRVPILIAQHMPALFTRTFAKRLGEISGLPSQEGEHGAPILPGITVAPGDYHMTVSASAGGPRILLDKGPLRNSLRPAADPLFETASAVWGASLLGMVLTGMGEDGLVGSRCLKKAGGALVIQNAASCVVFGMPGAVFAEGLHDADLDLPSLSALMKKVALK